jgi:uncharacterized membrane protein
MDTANQSSFHAMAQLQKTMAGSWRYVLILKLKRLTLLCLTQQQLLLTL